MRHRYIVGRKEINRYQAETKEPGCGPIRYATVQRTELKLIEHRTKGLIGMKRPMAV